MKLQDIVFLVIIAFLAWRHNPRYFVIAGLIMLIVAIPLYAKWIFFTAERLTMYAGVCMLIAVILFLFMRKEANK